MSLLPKGFVDLKETISDILIDLRYLGPHNFTGENVPGYQNNRGILTWEAAEALKQVQGHAIRDGFSLVVYDAYRPQRACDAFVAWQKAETTHMKNLFYPDLTKDEIFAKKYIYPSSSHSRGSTIDLTLLSLAQREAFLNRQSPWTVEERLSPSGRPYPYLNDHTLDMGGHFDFFGERSFSRAKDITQEQQENRNRLRTYMETAGFKPLTNEWWHFTLSAEPFPDTYFDFDVA